MTKITTATVAELVAYMQAADAALNDRSITIRSYDQRRAHAFRRAIQLNVNLRRPHGGAWEALQIDGQDQYGNVVLAKPEAPVQGQRVEPREPLPALSHTERALRLQLAAGRRLLDRANRDIDQLQTALTIATNYVELYTRNGCRGPQPQPPYVDANGQYQPEEIARLGRDVLRATGGVDLADVERAPVDRDVDLVLVGEGGAQFPATGRRGTAGSPSRGIAGRSPSAAGRRRRACGPRSCPSRSARRAARR